MRPLPAFLGLLLTALVLAPSGTAAGLWSGPFVGAVSDDQIASHAYDTNAPGTACLDVYRPVTYTVRLTHSPVTDTLTLAVPAHGVTVDSANGVASVSFVANYCTRFTVQVTGTDVADAAFYAVQVSSSGAGSLGGLS